MHILYLHQYFRTRQGGAGTRSYEFAKYLINSGHRVTMICSGIGNEERLVPAPGDELVREEIDGIDVISLAAGLAQSGWQSNTGSYRRMGQFMQFARAASKIGPLVDRPDVVFATHTPLTIGIPAMRLSREFGVPFIFEVRDLWPDALVNIGALSNPGAIWAMRRLERRIYKAADRIVALSPGMRDGVIAGGGRADHVTVIPNSSDIDLFRPDLRPGPAFDLLPVGDRVSAIYFGAMGYANGLGYAVEAARILQNRGNDNIVIILHGSGGERLDLEQQVADYGLTNVIFSDPVDDKSEVAGLVAGADIALTIYRAAKETSWSPNKLFDALAAGKPVVVNVGGWLKEIVDSVQCGLSVDPERPSEMADALEQLAGDPGLRSEMGIAARRLAEERFERGKLAHQLEEVLVSAISDQPGHMR